MEFLLSLAYRNIEGVSIGSRRKMISRCYSSQCRSRRPSVEPGFSSADFKTTAVLKVFKPMSSLQAKPASRVCHMSPFECRSG